jgi:hypothetical protein
MVDKHTVRTPGEALAYIVDCTLATVETLAMKKSRSKAEFERQVAMGQSGVDWMRSMKVDFSTTRAKEVVESFNGNVMKWAERSFPK